MGETGDLNHRRRGSCGVEKFLVRPADLFLIADVGDEHPGAHDVLHGEAGFTDRVGWAMPKAVLVWRWGSPTPTTSPLTVAVVPATNSAGPATTAREYP